MKTLLKVVLVLVGLWCANEFLLAMFSPSGVWVRREVREHPLAHPLKADAVDGLSISAAGQTYRVAGVRLPTEPDKLAALTEFVRVAVAQGIEIDESASLPSGASIRCEPRIWHWCGNDPVAAHFQQMNLNEIILALGYAALAPEVSEMSSPAALRLRAAARWAEEGHTGDYHRRLTYGIDISAIMCVDAAIQQYVYDLREQNR